MIPDDQSRLRKIERELYTTDIVPPSKRAFLHDKKVDAPEDWADQSVKARTNDEIINSMPTTGSAFKKVFFGSLIFLFLALVFFGVSLVTGGNSISANNVDVSITAKEFVDGGESFPVDVAVVNKNKLPLELATLTLQYPDSSSIAVNGMSSIPRDIGTLGVGNTHDESFMLQLYGEQNSQKQITAHMEFRVAGSNVVYTKDESVNVTVRSSPVNLTLSAPQSIIPNQEIPLIFSIVGNGTTILSNTAMVAQYPDGFTFTHADPMPSFGNNVWYLGDLPPGANRTIKVYGTLAGGSDAQSIKASIGAQNANNEQKLDTTYNSVAQILPLTNAFLDAKITLSGSDATGSTIPITSDGSVNVTIPWQNTLATQLTNAEIHVHLSGSAYDSSLVQSGIGFFDSANNQIIWTKQQVADLAMINPGATGTVSFSFKPKQVDTNISNPSVIASIDVVGYQAGGGKLSAAGIDRKTFVLNSDLNLLTRTLYYSGSITNSGPMPPKPNNETTYTLEFQITNFRNQVKNVQVTTTLPVNVSWKNVEVPQSEAANVQYNAVTKTMVWNAGDIPAGTGSTLPARMLSVKVGIIPSSDDAGSIPALTGDIDVTGQDQFTGAALDFTKHNLDTRLLNDSSDVGADGLVAQ